jgi:hypothetical protein
MDAHALITAESPEEAVDVFLRREDAELALAECLHDEPDWTGLLRVVRSSSTSGSYRPLTRPPRRRTSAETTDGD